MWPAPGTAFFNVPSALLRDVILESTMSQNNKNNDNNIAGDFFANVLKHDAFRKGVAACAAGTLFAIASVAIFGPSEPS